MTELWLLPGPSRLARRFAAQIETGNQVSFAADPSWEDGLRQAVSDVLAFRGVALNVVFDDDAPPSDIVAHTGAAQSSAVFWVTGIDVDRAEAWEAELDRSADRQRNDPPAGRTRFVAALPRAPRDPGCPGHAALLSAGGILSRTDLEVAARYRAAERGENPVLLSLLVEVCVPLAASGGDWSDHEGMLEALESWLAMPLDCIGSVGLLADHAARKGLAAGDAVALRILLARAQQSVLWPEVDARRLALLGNGNSACRVPYEHPRGQGLAPERVDDPRLLELAHLSRRAGPVADWGDDPWRARLDELKRARDKLCHFKPLSLLEIREMLAHPSCDP